MNKLLLLISVILPILGQAQVLCIKCYYQNAPVLTDTNNLIVNGGFEMSNCVVNSSTSVFCPNSSNYSCDITNWTCTGGGINTYARVVGPTWVAIGEGARAVYLGNHYARSCSALWTDTSCVSEIDCQVMGIPAGYPYSPYAGYADSTGVSLEQSVNGLTIGGNYSLEFWAGGESATNTKPGLFAVDVGFGKIFMRDPATPPTTGIGKRFVITFTAASTTHTFKFTNWGHIHSSSYYYCTELVLDDVRLFANNGNPCITGFENIPETSMISVSPNPCTDKLIITSDNNNKSEIVLYDITGRSILQQEFAESITLSTEQLSDGLYNYVISTKGIPVKRGKIIKQ
jgi:hypothetical protein